MQVVARGQIYDATRRPPAGRIAYFTSLCLLRSGTMLSGFQVGPAKHAIASTIGLCRSRDGGHAWHDLPARFATLLDGAPGSLSGAELHEIAPGRLILFSTWFDRTDPARPLFDPETEGILHSRQLYCFSEDEGESWSDWQRLSTGELTGCALTGPVAGWSDGSFAFAFESFKEYDDPRPARHGAWAVVSRDGGKTFSAPVPIAQHPEQTVYYWDQRLCAGPSPGEFIALFWTHDLVHKRDLTVRLRHATLSEPFDHGSIRDTGIPGQIAAPCLLPDGRLLAFAVDRQRPGTLKLWSSPNGGRDWPERDALTVHVHDEQARLSQGRENIDFKQYWEDMGKWSFGHPAARLLPDGNVFVAHYAGSPDCMSIHWAKVAV